MPSLPIKLGLAVRRLDQELYTRAGQYPDVLPVGHLATLEGWSLRLCWVGGVLVRYSVEEFERLDPLERQLEVNRAHAEALLALCRAGEIGLSDDKEEWLFQRALGIFPSNEDQVYEEIASCPELEPNYMTSRAERYVKGIVLIRRSLGQGAALGYGALLAAGVRSLSDLVRYGAKIQQLFDAFVRKQTVYAVLERVSGGIRRLDMEEQLMLAAALREHLTQGRWRKQGRFLTLTQVVDGCLEPHGTGMGDGLGLAMLDSIMAGKLFLPVRHLMWQDQVFLEVSSTERTTEFWSPFGGLVRRVPAEAKGVEPLDVLVEGYLRMARSYTRVRSFSNGARVARWVLGLSPGSAEAHDLLAQCLLGLEQPKQAREECLEAIRLDPKFADAHHTLGNVLAMMRRWPEAVASYKQAVALRPGFASALNNLGLALVNCAERERALEAYEEAIRVRPDYAEAYYNMGNLYLEMSRYDDAVKAYSSAVEYEPGMSGAYYNMGQAYYSAGDLARSLEAYLSAVRVNPKHAGAWHNMGIVYRDLGQKERAVEAIEKAVQLNPTLFR